MSKSNHIHRLNQEANFLQLREQEKHTDLLTNIKGDIDSNNVNTSQIDAKISKGSEDTLPEAQQVCIYARKDATPSGLRALKSTNDGTLFVKTNHTAFNKDNEIVAIPASGTGSSTAIVTQVVDVLGIAATSTNQTDVIEIYVSNDDVSYYPTNIKGVTGGVVYAEFHNPAFHYYKVVQTDTTGSPHTFNLICSKR